MCVRDLELVHYVEALHSHFLTSGGGGGGGGGARGHFCSINFGFGNYLIAGNFQGPYIS